jgi:uncharacterized protein YqgC (DUF456 family)
MRRIQFRLWHLMFTVAVVALLVAGLVWLFPPKPPSVSVLTYGPIAVTLNFAGYKIPHTSPIFWVITAILLAAVLGILAGLIAAFIWAARTLSKPRSRIV